MYILTGYDSGFFVLTVDRVQRTEQIVMGTAGTVLDWILKKKVIKMGY